MQAIKIVVTGAYAAGKTSFIRAVSEIDMVSTEYDVTNPDELAIKTETTVALDFGMIAINDESTLYLFGTPGQSRFDFMWEILSLGCIGYVVLVDSCRPAHLNETAALMAAFATHTSAPFIVAANKQDDPTALPVSYIRKRLHVPYDVPVVPCIGNDRESVKSVLLSLLAHIEQSFSSG
ncbi:MAG: ATP/GTP-binding protein [Roseiflexaceae bacterium]|nr:ATP/GTP-binding protein [Roseiflexaceae bacterium]